MILQLDMDGVLADWTAGFRTILDTIVPGLARYTSTTKPAWYDEDVTKDQNDRAWAVVKGSPCFWRNLPPIPTAEELKALAGFDYLHDLYFVTARVGYQAKTQTEEWLRKHVGLMNPTVIITTAKAEVAAALHADHALEDNASNAIAIGHCARTQAWLVNRPYNQFEEARLGVKVRRVPTLGAFLKGVA